MNSIESYLSNCLLIRLLKFSRTSGAFNDHMVSKYLLISDMMYFIL